MTYGKIISMGIISLFSKEAALLMFIGFLIGLGVSNLVKRVKARKEV